MKAYCASDVFSYGLTLWEMLEREYPHGNKKDHEIYQFYEKEEVSDSLIILRIYYRFD